MMTLSTSGCAKEFHHSPKYTTWGCSCCRSGKTYPGFASLYYNIYLAYKGITPPSTTTTTTTTPDAANAPHGLIKKTGYYCSRAYKYFSRVNAMETCAMMTLATSGCSAEFQFNPQWKYCACCAKGKAYPGYKSTSYNIYLAYKGTTPPGPTTTTTPGPPRGYLMSVNRSCQSSHRHFRLTSLEACAKQVLSYRGCGKEFHFAPKYTRWGCSCCRSGQAYPGYYSQNYNIYHAYTGKPPSTTTTTTTTPDAANAPHGLLVAKKAYCYWSFKYFNLPNVNADACAMMTLATKGCAKEFMMAPSYPTWGCSCCRPDKAYPARMNENYNMYLAYKGTTPPSTTTTTTTTPDA